MRTGFVLTAFVSLACLTPAAPSEADVSPSPSVADTLLTLSLPDAPPADGTPVTLELRVANDGGEPLVLDFPDGQRYDFEVFAADGASVWRWSDGMFFIQVLGRETLAPGMSLRWTEGIDAGLPAGTYRVVATLTTVEPRAVEDTLTVVPGG